MKRRKPVLDQTTPIYVAPSSALGATSLPTTSVTVGVTGAAELLHVHPNRVLELIDDGAIPAGKVGRAWVMMTRDVVVYLEKVIIAQTADRLSGRRTRKNI